MATSRPSLKVEQRSERGSRAIRRLRRTGYVPGVLYGGSHEETVAFKVGEHDLRRMLIEGTALFDVEIDGEKPVPAILKERQLHPVRDEVMHVDLLEVNLREKIHASVAVELTGGDEAPGVREGGVLDHITREIEIEALPTDIPEQVTLDVSGLDIGGTLSLTEIELPEGVELLHEAPDEVTIATVVPPTKVEEPTVEEETEVVGEGDGDEAAADESGSGSDSGDGE